MQRHASKKASQQALLTELPEINNNKQDLIPLSEMLVTDISPINRSPLKDDNPIPEPVTLTKVLTNHSERQRNETNQVPEQFQEVQSRLDFKLSSLQSKLDKLDVQFDMEKDGYDYFNQLQEDNFKFFANDATKPSIVRNPLDIHTLTSVTKLPSRPIVPPLSEQLANFKS